MSFGLRIPFFWDMMLWHLVLGSQHFKAHCVLKIHIVSWYTHKHNFIYAHKKNMPLPVLTLMKTINTQQNCIQSLIQISSKSDSKCVKYGL